MDCEESKLTRKDEVDGSWEGWLRLHYAFTSQVLALPDFLDWTDDSKSWRQPELQ